jgi:tripartite-type tricarboxylate transporter receptor subunit TctC
MKTLRRLITLTGILSCFLISGWTAAAEYPTRAVRIIVSLPPGSGADTTARFISKHLTEKLGQPFVVENRPGANSFIAAKAAADAAPDGYTLFVASNSPMVTNVAMFKRLPYDAVKDFTPVAPLARFPMVLVVPTASPYKTMEQLFAAARSTPGKLNYGSGTPAYQVALEILHEQNGVKSTPVPYKGTAPALTDLAGGNTDYSMAEVSAVMPLINGGHLRALAVASNERIKELPGVPTVAESSRKVYESYAWTGVFFPAKVPADIVSKMSDLIRGVMASPEGTAFIVSLGGMSFPGGSRELRDFQLAEIEKTKRAVKIAGIEPE